TDEKVSVDAIECTSDQPAGRLVQITPEDLIRLRTTRNANTAHDTSLPEAIEVLKRIGLDLPGDISIYGISVHHNRDFGEQMTPEVEQAVPAAASAVLSEINPMRDTREHAEAAL
ncbi:MAG: hydrogenase maturation protease, partial [Rhodothermales bacterium]|nr:hydrogenase maturation protease [Rhodothermales bacterium]